MQQKSMNRKKEGWYVHMPDFRYAPEGIVVFIYFPTKKKKRIKDTTGCVRRIGTISGSSSKLNLRVTKILLSSHK